jgi:type I restriction enzyme, S subunit
MSSQIIDRFAGDVPSGWHRVLIGEALREASEPIKMHDSQLYRLVSIRRRNGGMFLRDQLYGRQILTKDLQRVIPGSFVIARRQIIHGASALASDDFADAALSSSYSLFVGRKNCDTRFFAWLAKHPLMYAYFLDASHGVVIEKMNFDKDRWLSYPINLPPLNEQRKIAEILDAADQAIWSAERHLAKLRQVKQGLLHDLLTCGIDESGNLRRRNVECVRSSFGCAPCEWTLVRGFEVFSLHGGFIPSNLESDGSGQLLYLKVDDFNHPMNGEGLQIAGLTFNQNHVSVQGIFKPGSIIFPKRGAAILKNRVSILRRAGTVDPNLMVLVPGPRLLPDWFRIYLQWCDLSTICDNSGIPQLNNKHLNPLVFAIPSISEQRRILDRFSACEKALRLEEAQLDKLWLLKRGLMDDLLMGRVRARALA